jgi:hypothetical protein
VTDQRATTSWPRLRLSDWGDTKDTLHMWTQIIGKIRKSHSPAVNHWWNATLYVSPRGLTTSTIPYRDGAFDIEFDLMDHRLHIRSSDGRYRQVALAPNSVAQFYAETMAALAELDIQTRIHSTPNEVDPAIPFAEDHEHAAYDRDAATLFWRQLLQANRVMWEYRAGFIGKSSPVHYFWGGEDLACSRFSGRPAPPYPVNTVPNCPTWVLREGYSREVASCGFWPGGGEEGAFYAYAYPEPPGYAAHPVRPEAASYTSLGEFVLPYEAVAGTPDPDRTLMDFLQSAYVAAADLAGWDRRELETDPHRLDHQHA